MSEMVFMDAPVAPTIEGESMTAENKLVMTDASRIAALAQRFADMSADLGSLLAQRKEAERQVAEFLSLFDLLRYPGKIFAACAPYGVDSGNAAGYEAFLAASLDAYDVSLRAIPALGGSPDAPTPKTHPDLDRVLESRATKALHLLMDAEVAAYIDECAKQYPNDPLMHEAMTRLNIAVGLVVQALLQTRQGDAVPALFDEAWVGMPTGSLWTKVTSLIPTVNNFLMSSALPLTGPNCLLQAAVEVVGMRVLVVRSTEMLSQMEGLAKSVAVAERLNRAFGRYDVQKFRAENAAKAIADSFGDMLKPGAREELYALFLDARVGKLKGSTTFQQALAVREGETRRKINAWVKKSVAGPEPLKYPKWAEMMAGIAGVMALVLAADNLLSTWGSWSGLERARNVVDVVNLGFSTVGTLLTLLESISEPVEKLMGRVCAVLGVVSAALTLAIAITREERDTEEIVKAAASLASASFLLVSVFVGDLAAGTSLAAAGPIAGLIGAMIAVGLVVWDLWKWYDANYVTRGATAQSMPPNML